MKNIEKSQHRLSLNFENKDFAFFLHCKNGNENKKKNDKEKNFCGENSDHNIM